METKSLFSQSDEPEKEIFDFGTYRIGYFIKKNLEKSAENEDSLFFYGKNGQWVCGVSDGVGGHPRGREASRIASEGVRSFFETKGFDHQVFLGNLEEINVEIRALKVGAKTTTTCALVKEDKIRLYSIGDSEALLCNTRGQLLYSNIPQSPVGYGVEAGLLDKKEALDDPDRHIVNHLLGDEVLRFEASSSIDFKKGYSLLVGTDGLFDNFHHDALLKIIGGGNFEESFEKLCQGFDSEAEEMRKDDDISFFFIRRVRSE